MDQDETSLLKVYDLIESWEPTNIQYTVGLDLGQGAARVAAGAGAALPPTFAPSGAQKLAQFV